MINTRANPSASGTTVTRAPTTSTVMRTGSWLVLSSFQKFIHFFRAWAQGRTSNKDASNPDNSGTVGSPPTVGTPPPSSGVQRPQMYFSAFFKILI